jgi:hypothetical protein
MDNRARAPRRLRFPPPLSTALAEPLGSLWIFFPQSCAQTFIESRRSGQVPGIPANLLLQHRCLVERLGAVHAVPRMPLARC